jgi:hypothetical protein
MSRSFRRRSTLASGVPLRISARPAGQAFKYQGVLGYAGWFARSMLDADPAPLDAE